MIASALLLSALAGQPPPTFTVLMPLGVPQFTHGAPWAGVLYGGLQLAGAGTATWSTIRMVDLAEAGSIDQELGWRMVSAGAVAFTAGAWFASVLDGSRRHDRMESQSKIRAFSARSWQACTWRPGVE